VLSQSDHKVILRNFEGFITTYDEPLDYDPTQAARPCFTRPEPGQAGIHGLLDGQDMFIKPQGFDELHDRGGLQHRLKDAQKWVPLGIGPGAESAPPAENSPEEKDA